MQDFKLRNNEKIDSSSKSSKRTFVGGIWIQCKKEKTTYEGRLLAESTRMWYQLGCCMLLTRDGCPLVKCDRVRLWYVYPTPHVAQNNRCHLFTQGLCDVGKLLAARVLYPPQRRATREMAELFYQTSWERGDAGRINKYLKESLSHSKLSVEWKW